MSARRAEEVSEQGGLRWMVVGLVLAVLLGTLVRLMVAPHKVEMAIRAQIEKSQFQGQIGFRKAEVEFASGPWPDFALVLTDVQWRPMAACEGEGAHRAEAPVRAGAVRLPLRWSSVLRAQFAMGRVAARDLVIDLDEVKRRCPDGTEASVSQAAPWQVIADAVANPSPVDAGAGREMTPAEFFRQDELRAVRRVLSGISVDHAELFFEGRMKSVVLESLRATVKDKGIDISTLVRIPPATVFGESLPAFSVRGTVQATEILSEVRAELNEGTLEANAELKPIVNSRGVRELDTVMKLSVSNLPLSMTTPLLVKTGIVPKDFRPRFAWLDCNAEIKGIFSRLIVDHPLTISQCEISGQVGRLKVDKAVREAQGVWHPFIVRAESVELGKVLETFQLHGAPGVFSEYGKFSGAVEVKKPDEFSFQGSTSGMVVRFAGGEGTALQAIGIGKLAVLGSGLKVRALAEEFKPEGGEAQLKLEAEHDLKTGDTEFQLDLARLKFNSRVEKVLFTGSVAEISGKASGLVRNEKLKRLKATLGFKGVQGTEFHSSEMRLEARLEAKSDGRLAAYSGAKADGDFDPVEIVAKAPIVEVPKAGFLFRILKPALLGWGGLESPDAKTVVMNHTTVKGKLLGSGFRWTSAQASIGPSVTLFSEGHVFRDQVLEAKLESKYPATSRLAWQVTGTWRRPLFAVANEELRRLLRKPDITFDSGRDGIVPFETAVVPLRHLGLAPGKNTRD